MKKTLLICLVMSYLTGCASIISRSEYPVSFNSEPSNATVQVTDENGVQVFNGTTPTTTILRSGESYFDSKSYMAKFSKPGYDSQISQITSSVQPWYWGNILFGGLIGMLLVDPVTGAMYRLDNTNITTNLPRTYAPPTHQAASPEESAPRKSSLARKLSELQGLFKQGLLTQEEYDKKREQLISNF